MNATSSRPRSWLVMSALSLIVVAIGGVVYYASTSESSGSSETCTTVTLSSTEVASTDCRLGLTFTLSIQYSAVAAGTNQTVTISIHNDKSSENNVTFAGLASAVPGELNPGSPDVIVFLLPSSTCSPNVPGYFAVYNSSSAPQQLNVNPPNLACQLSGPADSWHQFSPLQTISQSFNFGGFYTSSDGSEPWINATYFEFVPGQQYEVFAFDGWGQLLTMSFSVI
jgi:hypothetical protein